MKNINPTKKYALIGQTLLVAAVLFVATPALAQNNPIDASTGNSPLDASTGNSPLDASTGNSPLDASTGNSPLDASTGNSPLDVSTGNSPLDVSTGNPPLDVSTGNPPLDVSTGNPPLDVSTGNPTANYPSPSYIVSGGSFSGGSSAAPIASYPSAPNSRVSNGSFSGGTSGSISISYPSAPNSTVSNGSFSGGSSAAPIASYPSAPNSTVSNGSFSGGNVLNNYFPTQTYFPNNQVLAANDTPNLSSVYLSDVPYTGAGDVLRVVLFTLALILWSIYVAYVILKRKQNNQEVFVSVTNGPEIKNDSFGIQNQIASDSQALEDIENYARTNKILLSTSASTKLLKLERLNQINSVDIINKMQKSDWVCIGESDLEKYL